MFGYTQGLPAPQVDDDDVEILLPLDAIVENGSWAIAAEDLTVAAGCALSRSGVLSGDEATLRCIITTAWETGALDSVTAFRALQLGGLVDLDLVMGMYAGYVRALARAEAL